MKRKRTLRIMMVALALMPVFGLRAKAKDSWDVVLFHDASLAGTRLASGRYHVQWEIRSPDAMVTFQQGKRSSLPPKGSWWIEEKGTGAAKWFTTRIPTARV